MKAVRSGSENTGLKKTGGFFRGNNFSGLNLCLKLMVPCICYLLTAVSAYAGEMELKPVLYMSFDNEQNPMQDTAGKHEMLKTPDDSQPKWVGDGKFGGAIEFDGKADYCGIKDAPDLNFKSNESFTVELWVKTSPADSKSNAPIIQKGGGKASWDIRSFADYRIGCFFVSNGKFNSEMTMMRWGNLSERWHHLAFVRDATEEKLRFYIDGILIVEKSLPEKDAFFDMKGSDLMLGKSKDNYFKGIIDELAVFKGVKRNFDLNIRPLEKSSSGSEAVYKPSEPKIEKPDPMVAASWEVLKKYQLNIVPAPKDIKVTGEAMAINPEEWSLEPKNDYLAPGIEFFNERIELAGGKALKENKDARNRIIIGDFESVKEYLPKIGNPEKPPRQGYAIGTFSEGNGKRVVIAGTDKEGALFGCVTLALALKKGDKNPLLYPMSVRDWPDFTHRMAGFCIIPYPQLKKVIDRAFALKLNMVQGASFYTTVPELLKDSQEVKKCFEYANKRGIRMLIVNHMAVEEGIPKFDPKTMPGYTANYYPYKTEEGLLADSHYGPGRAFTWCRDDLMEKRGRQLDQLLTETDGNSVFLHAMDTGGVDNPGNWAKRTPMDIKRWGNDRAAAEANILNIFHKNMIKNHPDLLFVTVEYPYGAAYLKYPQVVEWLTRLNKLADPSIYFCMRENTRENVKKWFDAVGERPQQIAHEAYPTHHMQFFSCSPRYARTFYFQDRKKDMYWMFSNSTLKRNLDPLTLVEAEYAWNTEAPGWGWYPEDAKHIARIDEQVPQINEELLPRALSIFYGEKAAPHIAKALSTGLSAGIAVNQSAFQGTSLSAYFKAKAGYGEEAVKCMETATPLVEGNEMSEFKFLSSLVKTAATLNKVKSMQLQARDDLASGKTEIAEQSILEAGKLLKTVNDPKWTSSLSKELDVAKNVGWFREKKKYLEQIKEGKIKVGIYNYGPYKSIVYSLNDAAGMKTGVFEDPQPDALGKFNAVIFNACNDTGDVYGDWRKAVRTFAENGGVVIFTHNAIGRYPSSGFGKQIFPEICSGYAGQQVNETELTVKKDIDGGFKAGDKYIHGYFDHLLPEPGKSAEILMVNKFDKPVMVGGKVGKGYVIYTGEIFGLSKENNDDDLTGDNWKMLFHTIRYAEKQR
jgi:hypothetical protein